MKTTNQICREVRKNMSREIVILGLDLADLIHDLDGKYENHNDTAIREEYLLLRNRILETSIDESYGDRNLLVQKLMEKYHVSSS